MKWGRTGRRSPKKRVPKVGVYPSTPARRRCVFVSATGERRADKGNWSSEFQRTGHKSRKPFEPASHPAAGIEAARNDRLCSDNPMHFAALRNRNQLTKFSSDNKRRPGIRLQRFRHKRCFVLAKIEIITPPAERSLSGLGFYRDCLANVVYTATPRYFGVVF